MGVLYSIRYSIRQVDPLDTLTRNAICSLGSIIMGEFPVLKILTMAGACILTLSACGTTSNLGEIKYRTDHLRFEKQEYEKSPGVLMRASVGAWGRYDEAAKLAAIIDYYIDPEQRLKPQSLRFKWGSVMDGLLDGLSGPEFKRPVPQELSPEEAQKRVQCLNDLFVGIAERDPRFLNVRYPLFKAEAQCSAFLSRNPIPMECIGWELSTSRGTDIFDATMTEMEGVVVNKCAS